MVGRSAAMQRIFRSRASKYRGPLLHVMPRPTPFVGWESALMSRGGSACDVVACCRRLCLSWLFVQQGTRTQILTKVPRHVWHHGIEKQRVERESILKQRELCTPSTHQPFYSDIHSSCVKWRAYMNENSEKKSYKNKKINKPVPFLFRPSPNGNGITAILNHDTFPSSATDKSDHKLGQGFRQQINHQPPIIRILRHRALSRFGL